MIPSCGLCESCEWGTIAKGDRGQEFAFTCSRFERRRMPSFAVKTCSGYENKNQTLYEMKKIAWNLLTDLKGRQIGFHSPLDTKRLVDTGKAQENEDRG